GCESSEPCLPRGEVVGQLQDRAASVGQLAMTPEDDRLNLLRFHCAFGPLHRAEARQPLARRGVGGDAGYPVMDQRVVANLIGGQIRVIAVPKVGHALLAADPTLETVAILRTIQNQETRARKADTVAPGRRLPAMSLGDEILEVTLPTAVIVREKN